MIGRIVFFHSRASEEKFSRASLNQSPTNLISSSFLFIKHFPIPKDVIQIKWIFCSEIPFHFLWFSDNKIHRKSSPPEQSVYFSSHYAARFFCVFDYKEIQVTIPVKITSGIWPKQDNLFRLNFPNELFNYIVYQFGRYLFWSSQGRILIFNYWEWIVNTQDPTPLTSLKSF